jgi:dienelactone hydrolase
VAAGVGLIVRLAPALSLSLALAVAGMESRLAPLLDDPVVEHVSIPVDGVVLAADLYRPAAPRGALLLVHGLSRAGRRHPELVRLARLLARHGRLVLVPQFEGLAAFRLSGREVAEVRAALRMLLRRTSVAGVVGFSFGAGPALLAAADVPDLALAASLGGYADLRNVIRYLTTGSHEFDGHRHEQRPEEYNRWKLLSLLVGFVQDERDRRALDLVAARRLADPGHDTSALEGDVSAEGRALLALVRNRNEHEVGALVAALPSGARAALQRMSPLAVVPRLPGRLLIAHGMDDASIPFTESSRLAAASQGSTTAILLETFQHTRQHALGPTIAGRARDALRLLRLTDALLAATR